MKKIILVILFTQFSLLSHAQSNHTFTLSPSDFLLDSKPFQIISGEIHPARVPREYWRNRIQMAKAMGCNTIAVYIFWNYYESEPGHFDFKSGNKDIVEFIRICQQEKMWVLLRPGPYVCAEWELGGLPPYLLRIPDIKLRCHDPRYMQAVERYIKELASLVKPLQCVHGGPILMMQVENEYGSFGNDKQYLEDIRTLWKKNGITIPFYTADGPTAFMLEAGNIDGCAIGLDSGVSDDDFAAAKKRNPKVPSFSSETYPGWLTHWGEKWARTDTVDLLKQVKYLLDNKKSFNLYVIHGGTNFGFTAGANSGGKGYEPSLTSYDYDAPINEQGQPTAKYYALRRLISKYVSNIPDVPQHITSTEFADTKMEVVSSVWNNLPSPILSVQPMPFEAYGQDYGFIIYKTKLIGHKSGKLSVIDLHDYGTVFLNGRYIGYLDRREGKQTIDIPKSDEKFPVLEILVEGMGRINFGQELIDRKGITNRVTLNGMTLMNWDVYKLPFDNNYISRIKSAPVDTARRGLFFKGFFDLNKLADTYIDMSNYKKGIVWVNGHNLGRYWEIGPQKRLYCPALWLKKNRNVIILFDLLQTNAMTVSGKNTLE